MPPRGARLCSCGAVVHGGGPCPTCAPRRKREQDAQRPTARQRGYSTAWDKARLGYLNHHPLCAACLKRGVETLATVVDHIIPHRGDKGLFWDKTNWQALCVPCHSGDKQAMEVRGDRPPGTGVQPRVTLVCGPPGSGKTTYVMKRCTAGDLVVDSDALFAALSGQPWYDKPAELLPFVKEAFDAMVRKVETSRGLRAAWIITGGARASSRNAIARPLSATVVVIETPPATCLRRIEADPRRASRAHLWQAPIDEWWRKYERQAGDTVINALSPGPRGGGSELSATVPGPAAQQRANL